MLFLVFCHLLPKAFDVRDMTVSIGSPCTQHSKFIRLRPRQCFTPQCDGSSCPHFCPFFTLCQSAITLKQSNQTLPLPKHTYGLSVLQRGNCQVSHDSIPHAQHSIQAIPVFPKTLPLCVFGTICMNVMLPEMPFPIFSVQKCPSHSYLPVNPFPDFPFPLYFIAPVSYQLGPFHIFA